MKSIKLNRGFRLKLFTAALCLFLKTCGWRNIDAQSHTVGKLAFIVKNIKVCNI